VRVGDLVKVEGGTLRPPWYGEMGIITGYLLDDSVYRDEGRAWHRVLLNSGLRRIIRDDMLVVVNESR